MSEISDRIRREFKAGDDIRDAGLTVPADVECFRDIVYGEDEKWQSLDVYRPKDRAGELLPVIVSVHGGGWVYGDKERYQYYCMSLAQRGFAVVNFTYRLAPENKYPASLEDTNLVFKWVLEHGGCADAGSGCPDAGGGCSDVASGCPDADSTCPAADGRDAVKSGGRSADEPWYGFDTRHIFAVGDSAGAHNLALYSAICTNPEYAKQYEFCAPEGFAPTAIALNCGKYEIVPEDAGTMALMAEYLPGRGTPEEIEKIRAVQHITPQFPPTFLMTATGDFLQDQIPYIQAKLMECCVPFEFHFYGDKDHSLGHVFHCNMRLEEAAVCNEEECAFFRKFL